MKLPIYPRRGIYYLHTRVQGVQIKKSLQTTVRQVAMLRAVTLLSTLHGMTKPKLSDFDFDPSALRKYELDLQTGRVKAEGPEDHQRLLQAIESLKSLQLATPAPAVPAQQITGSGNGRPLSDISFSQLSLKFFAMKSTLSKATVTDYTATAKEFSEFTKHAHLRLITEAHITAYMEFLSQNKNTPRTIDKKIGCVRALFNFALAQKYFVGTNPALGRTLLRKKDTRGKGSKKFDLSDLQKIFCAPEFQESQKSNPHLYWMLVLGVLTGIRVTACSAIRPEHLKTTPLGVHYIHIDADKTAAGQRDIPIVEEIFKPFQEWLISVKKFNYENRSDGKGASDPVRKDFTKLKEKIGYTSQEKHTYHSLRKFLNTFLMHEKVTIEVRSQYLGHELDNVNKQIYGEPYSIEELADFIFPAQRKLIEFLKLVQK